MTGENGMAKILVADDAMFMRMALRKILEAADYEVCEARDGEEMIRVYEQEKPDLITLDITMPKMDGLEGLKALKEKYPHWNVYVSKNISDSEYGLGNEINSLFDNFKITNIPELHLNVSIRSFRSENLAYLVKNILDNKIDEAKIAYERIKDKYPILITRDINKAKQWLRTKARGTERFGIVASSNSRRLKPYGLFSQLKIYAPDWFLNAKDDINSSYFLEDVATEFDVQGLELDWTCVAWDADMQYRNGDWIYKIFRGKNWQKLSDVAKIAYKRNAYRVLLTRARQGMIIFVPPGNETDKTHLSEFYNETFYFFREIGITEI